MLANSEDEGERDAHNLEQVANIVHRVRNSSS